MKKLISNSPEGLVQFIKFSLVGALNSMVHFFVFVILYRGASVHYLASSAIGYCVGMINSYIFNRRWTFSSRQEKIKKEFGKFAIVNILALLVNVGSLRFFKENVNLSAEAGQVCAIGLSLIMNFLGNRYWTFKNYEGSFF
jgi:putative flippase GtrA